MFYLQLLVGSIQAGYSFACEKVVVSEDPKHMRVSRCWQCFQGHVLWFSLNLSFNFVKQVQYFFIFIFIVLLKSLDQMQDSEPLN